MGKDEEVPEHFGLLHSETLTPHRAIWALTIISAVVGCVSVSMVFGDAAASSITDATVKALDKVMKDIEQVVETADEKKLEGMASTIAHIGQHNAYHVGQIIFVRKLQGSWNPEKGVK